MREEIVPALFGVLERETNNDLVTGALIALAKIGDGGSAEDGLRLESALARFLTDKNQEIRETAAVSLGILASPRSIPALSNLLWNTPQGREQVKRSEVDYRTRAFAAYGLGLIGARTEHESDRQVIVAVLRRALESDSTPTKDLAVASLNALSVVPLTTLESPPSEVGRALPPESSRAAQLEFLLGILCDAERPALVRAQCPIALTRLLAGLPVDRREPFRERIGGELVDLVRRGRERAEILQSAVLALGEIGTNDGTSPLDRSIRAALEGAPKEIAEPQARGFALIALAHVGGRSGADPTQGGLGDVADFLCQEVASGKSAQRPWAGLACGLLGYGLAGAEVAPPALERLRRTVRTALEDERDPSRVGAYAIASGLLRDRASAPLLLARLEKELPDDARGHVAVALALMGHVEAVGTLRERLSSSMYRPYLLRESAIALGILEDKEAAPLLAKLLKGARGLAAQYSVATALGFIGDRRSIEPLLEALGDGSRSEAARAFVAAALGNVADKESLPWNSKLALGLNYSAATATLTDPATATGILDIL